MDTITVQNQGPVETFESKLITINGTSSQPTEHVYRVRKSLHPQNTSNQLYLHKTQHSSNNSFTIFCQFCNKHNSFASGRYCACQDRQFHEQCLLNHIYTEHQQGNSIFFCSYCNLYYPTEVESICSLKNMSKNEIIKFAVSYLIIALAFIVEILIICFLHIEPIIFIVLAILFTIQLLILVVIIKRMTYYLCLVKFKLKEYRYGDEIIQFIYAANAIKIVSALKYNRAKKCQNLSD